MAHHASHPRSALVTSFVRLAAEAGRLIVGLSASGFEQKSKEDSSPVTNADEQAERILLAGLERLLPGVPILAEESVSQGIAPSVSDTFLVVDPLDGTREYVSGRPEYTVNIGLIFEGRPEIGVLHAPALGRTYWGIRGEGAARAIHAIGAIPEPDQFTSIATRPPANPPVALTSRGHNDAATEAFLDEVGAKDRRRLGSALKFALVAEGSADLYARFVGTMEWDTAAGEAILAAAGGAVRTPEGTPIEYGKAAAEFRNGPFIAWGRAPRA